VLLVDDEELVLDVADSMLRRLGYQVVIARGGHEALAMLRRDPAAVDLVILDLIMPEMGGSRVLSEIRRLRPELPVLLSSGHNADSEMARSMVGGCNGFIQKPFDLNTLAGCVRQALGGA
jgi:CheY-like chemotaxis protein